MVRIDKFFKHLISININLNVESILNELKKYEIEENKLGKVDGIHEKLINDYRETKTINVFKYQEKEPFCHLINLFPDNERWEKIAKITSIKKTTPGRKTSPNKDPIKLYLSLDKEHLFKGSKIIFNYLVDENIEHISNVANSIRTDNIIIRVFNKKDAEKIINFVNTHPYLNQGHLKTNPFLMNVGIVGLAQDNYNSYYNVVAAFIKEYLKDCKKKNKLDSVNRINFYEFVANYNINNEEFIKDARKTSNINYENDVKYIKEIQNLLLINMASNNIDDFYNHFKSVRGNKHSLNSKSVIETIIKAYDETKLKYGKEAAQNGILHFLQTGEGIGITRMIPTGENIREELIEIGKDKCKEEILKYTKAKKIVEAVYILDEVKKEKTNNQDYNQIIKLLREAFNATLEKYNMEQAVYAMKLFLENNFSRFITRYDSNNNEIRDNVKLLRQEVIKSSIKKYIKENNLQMIENDYIKTILNDFQTKASFDIINNGTKKK